MSRNFRRRFFCLAAILAVAGLSLSDASAQGADQVVNGSFDAGTAPWWWTGNAPASVVDGRLCATVPAGTVNPWDAIIGQNDIPLISGESYALSFTASATTDVGVRANVQLADPPFTAEISQVVILGPTPQTFTFSFTSRVDTDAGQVAFQIGGADASWGFCVDDVSLIGGVEPPTYEPDTGPRVRVNQVGYLPRGPKRATLVTEATDPLPWQLRDGTGAEVASGMTTPRGVDPASGENVHTLDFTAHTAAGTGYTLTADGETSVTFGISGEIYRQLRSDALQFFYIQRSGTAIDGALVGQDYARPPGHVGVAPNQGDLDVPCQPGVCDYRLDVRGGWYDAGDHGKYVVNGGIATAQLLGAYERTKTAPSAIPGALEDSTLRVPERGNGVPDILDEARWELEFMLRMQVPPGQPLAGMVHHKIHDANWTGLPLQPEDDPQLRELHPVSTAATLNLAAVAAQAARLFAPYDAPFAARSLAAARTAWTAALANPGRFASDADSNGGGAYGDRDVTDEFYWAAVELYLTTGEQAFLNSLLASPHHTAQVFSPGGFNWPSLAALARLDLATVPSRLPSAERQRIRASVVAGADAYLATLRGQAYGLPMPAGPNFYIWGSNSNILNNVVVLATAYDLTGDLAYRDGALEGVDYIFGRNALNHSYVTGYGERSSLNQHSRIFARQIDPNLPNPPPGSISGGANAGLQDPLALRLLTGCVLQFCFIDDIESFSTNEVAINWNSTLSWVASFLADQGTGDPAAPGACRVRYTVDGEWPGAFIAQVILTNTGTQPISNWNLVWSFTGAQRVTQIWNATATQSGARVTAVSESWNRTIRPGQSVNMGFLGTSFNANPAPELVTVNGATCSVGAGGG
jgi:endoglucanase